MLNSNLLLAAMKNTCIQVLVVLTEFQCKPINVREHNFAGTSQNQRWPQQAGSTPKFQDSPLAYDISPLRPKEERSHLNGARENVQARVTPVPYRIWIRAQVQTQALFPPGNARVACGLNRARDMPEGQKRSIRWDETILVAANGIGCSVYIFEARANHGKA
mmetsp:Transcript_95878/g.200409  ORF Transcript_95878/g.200409 Transcript_95878/m.200409 type:complete len:162 (+) Transcript_95878:510-995(+)